MELTMKSLTADRAAFEAAGYALPAFDYEAVKKNAFDLYNKDLFNNTILVIGKETGMDKCHEFIFLVPTMESENIYDEIENEIYMNIWKRQ